MEAIMPARKTTVYKKSKNPNMKGIKLKRVVPRKQPKKR